MESGEAGDTSDTESYPSSPSTQSSPTYEPFRPKYELKIKEPIKDGRTVHYTLHVKDKDTGHKIRVEREYEDFETLHHRLNTQPSMAGVIIPALPAQPVVEASSSAEQSKVQLGNSTKQLIADEFLKDCRRLEKYLRLLINHSVLANDHNLKEFLTNTQTLAKVSVRKGLLSRLSSAVEESMKVSHRDIDDYFQKERDAANTYALSVTSASINFDKMVCSEKRIPAAYAHLVTALSIAANVNTHQHATANNLFIQFSQALEDIKHCCDVDATNDENTMGFHLNLYRGYAASVKEMLFRRTCLLLSYQDANKALDKAKPHQQQNAEELKVNAESNFEDCSEVARTELLTYQEQRRIAFQQAIVVYVEAKIRTARDTYAVLAKSLSTFKQLQI